MLRRSSSAVPGFVAAVLLMLGALCLPPSALAQRAGDMPAVFDSVGVTEHLGETIPGDVTLVDSEGQPVQIEDVLGRDRPVLLNLVYHDCPMLCNLVLDGLTAALKDLSWTPGDQFEVLTVSFNAAETPDLAARQKASYLTTYGRPEAARGWHFLTGDAASLDRLTDAVGFQYQWVEQQQQFAHPAVLIFLSPSGKISRYLYGLEYDPSDVRTALVEASEGTVGSTIDRVLLFCLQYDPNANSYVADAINIMKLGGLLTVLALGTVLLIFWKREGASQQREVLPDNLDDLELLHHS
jgi:protein SCO1/2